MPTVATYLYLDTSRRTGDYVLFTADQVLAEQSGSTDAADLLPTIDQLLVANNLTLVDLAGLIVCSGPGSFTGLRIGAATANTIHHQLDIPLFTIDALTLLLARTDADTVAVSSTPVEVFVRSRASDEVSLISLDLLPEGTVTPDNPDIAAVGETIRQLFLDDQLTSVDLVDPLYLKSANITLPKT